MKKFDRFYDTEVSVYSENDGDYDVTDTKSLLGSIMCDVQPYDADTDSNIYGLEENKAYKLYCAENDLIKSGRRIELRGEWFRVVRAEDWKLGMSAIVRGI